MCDEIRIVRDNYQEYVDFYFDPSKPVSNIPVEISNKLAEGLTSTGGLDLRDPRIDLDGAHDASMSFPSHSSSSPSPVGTVQGGNVTIIESDHG